MDMDRVPLRPHRSPGRTVLAGLATGVLALTAAACGGPSAAPAASSRSAQATASASGGSEAHAHAAMLAFAACMRAHGVSGFPDPTGGGTTIQRVRNGRITVNGQTINVSAAQFHAAQRACRSKLPANTALGNPAQTARMQQLALKYAACMRAHGVSNFPDPQVTHGGIVIRSRGIDLNSPRFQAAQRACRSLSPLVRAAGAPGGAAKGG